MKDRSEEGSTTDATAEFFDELGERGHEPVLEKTTGTLRFDLTEGERTTRWLVVIDKGDIAVSHRNAKADCVVRTSKAAFDGIASGAANPFAALLRGAISIEGDQTLILPFQRLFRGRPRAEA